MHTSHIIRPAFLFATTFIASSVAHADALQTADKWGGHIDLEGKAGTDRNLGETDLFIPLWQDDDTLTFTSIRARMDDNNSHEGNFGLGIRQMLDTGWNIGGYGYFDRRHSPYGNKFNQLTFGAEALSLDWDFRANAYLPVGTTQYMEDSLSTVDVSGTTLMYRQGEERALRGFDGEIGWRVPLFEDDAGQQLRAYAGGYRFTENNVDTVQGPRGRLDLTFDEVPFLWEGSRFSLGAEIQHDSPRGTQGFASFRLRIPLQGFGGAPKPRLTAMGRRMTDPIIRDIDVISQAGQFSEASEITQTADGETITLLNSNSTSAADFATAIANAGTNSTVILSGAYTSINSMTTVQDGQTIIGGGALAITTPTGRSVTVAIPDASISGEGDNGSGGPNRFFEMADNSSLIGVTASINRAGSTVIAHIDGKQNVTIRGNTLTSTVSASTASAFLIKNSHDITIDSNDVSIVANGSTGQFIAFTDNNSNISVNNNSVSMTGSILTTDQHYILLAGGVTINNLSGTGNTSNIARCYIVSTYTITGSITTNGTTCP
ncbi:inverse autotransporter beta domain-containing protein [Thalassospira povalilytica]|uniref:Inverse autotransporter beta domain-containing protein n=1 Tax=Thalassospira povalilytica TaxID=732237 RepID=A0A8I1SJW7_9PROT|nr:inverse autotransporter beta domain-containing protein [Thalassospira povalilytica]MBN8197035.1 inverse autotransporter beta domain-containing protein [Thalassospira povalilytica]